MRTESFLLLFLSQTETSLNWWLYLKLFYCKYSVAVLCSLYADSYFIQTSFRLSCLAVDRSADFPLSWTGLVKVHQLYSPPISSALFVLFLHCGLLLSPYFHSVLFSFVSEKKFKDKKVTTVSTTSLVKCIQLSEANVYYGFSILGRQPIQSVCCECGYF